MMTSKDSKAIDENGESTHHQQQHQLPMQQQNNSNQQLMVLTDNDDYQISSDVESDPDLAYSPSTRTLISFREREGLLLLKKCWYAGLMTLREDIHMITGSTDENDDHTLLQRCFLVGTHRFMAGNNDPELDKPTLIAKCFTAGLFK